MRHIKPVFLLLFLFAFLIGNGQTYYMSTTAQVNTCSGTFKDSDACNGATGNYCNSETYTRTFCSSVVGQQIKFAFSLFQTETYFDVMYVYDGPNTGSPILAMMSGSRSPFNLISTSGCLTFRWVSDITTRDLGWSAAISCITPAAQPPCGSNLAASDNCSDATLICNFSGYCGNTSSSYSVDMPSNMSDATAPLTVTPILFNGVIDNNSWIKFVADATSATFTLTSSGCANNKGIQAQIYSSTNCTNFATVSPFYSPGTQGTGILTATGLTIGESYYIMIDGWAGDVCNYTVTASTGVQISNISSSSGSTICNGQSTTLTANASGTGLTYLWAPGGSTNQSINVSPTSTITYTCTVTGTGPCGNTQTLSTTITVNDVPATSTSASVDRPSICAPSSGNISLSAVGGGGFGSTLNWYTASCGGTLVGTGNPLVITAPASTTTYFARWQNSCGNSGCVSTTVTIVPSPTAPTSISVDRPTICAGAGGNISLTASGGSGTTLTWYSGSCGGTLVGTGSPLVIPAPGATTTYFVRWQTASCGNSSCISVPVNITPLPGAPTAGSNSPVCEGQSINLTASNIAGASGYNWTGPNTYSSSSQNPTISNATTAMAGIYSVTATANGCTGPAGTVNVTVNPLPVAPVSAIVDRDNFCADDPGNILLTANGGSGTTAAWYTGSCGGGLIGTGASLSIASPAVTTTYYVRWENSCGNSTCQSIIVNVLPLPVAPTSANVDRNNFCADDPGNISLSAAGGSGTTLNWYTGSCGGTLVGSGTPLSIASPVANTIYYVQWENGCGVSTCQSVNVNVTALPAAPTAGSNSPVCSGQTINLTASLIGSASYSWTGPNAFSSTSQNPNITNATVAMAGVYSVTVTVSGCTGPAGTTTVTVNPLPSIDSEVKTDASCGLTDGTITITASGGNSPYQYSINNGTSFFSNGGSFTGLAAGNYPVAIIDANGCRKNGSTLVVANPGAPIAPAAGTNATYCDGDVLVDLTATAGSGGALEWYSDPGLTTSLGLGGTLTPSSTIGATNYYVTETIGACESPSTTVTITINAQPTSTVSGGGTICDDGSTTNVDIAFTGTAPWTFTYAIGATNQAPITTSSNPYTIATSSAGNYTVTTVNDANCSGTASGAAMVNVNPLPTATISGGGTVCTGNTSPVDVAFTGTAPYTFTYAIDGSNQAPVSTSSNPYTISASSNGSYTLVSVSDVNCNGTVSGSANVIINPLPTVSFSADTTICPGGNAEVTFTFTGQTDFTFQYALDGTPINVGPLNSSSFTILSGDLGIYTFNSLVDGNGCSAASVAGSSTVSETTAPSITNAITSFDICSGDPININPTADIVGSTFNWTSVVTFGTVSGNTASGTANISDILNNATTNNGTVTYNIEPTGPGPKFCVGNAVPFTVDVAPNPTITSANPDQFICSGDQANINITSDVSGTTFNWTASLTSGSVTGFIASGTGNNISHTLVNSGTVNGEVTYTFNTQGPAPFNCTGSSKQVIVTVYPRPNLTNTPLTQTICSGGTAALGPLVADVAGSTFNWISSVTGGSVTGNTPSGTIDISDVLTNSGLGSGEVTYIITPTANGCTGNSSNFIVTVLEDVKVSNSPLDTAICSGAQLAVNLTSNIPGASFAWTSSVTSGSVTGNTPSSNGNITDILQQLTGISGTVRYTITPSFGACVGNSTFYDVTVYGSPSSSITNSFGQNPVLMCAKDTVDLLGNASGGSTIYTSHTWTGDVSGLSQTNINNPKYTNSVAGVYNVTYTVTDHRGCSGSSSLGIEVYGLPTPSINASSSVCAGTPLTINVNQSNGLAPYSGHFWSGSGSGSLTATNSVPTSFKNNSGGTYFLYYSVDDANNCRGYDTLQITVYDKPVIDESAITITPSSCGNADGSIIGVASTGAPVINFDWYNSSNVIVSNSVVNSDLDPAGAGNYYLIVTDGNGCKDTTNVLTINDAGAPNPIIVNTPLLVCATNDLIIDAEPNGGTGPWDYAWTGANLGNLLDPMVEDPTFNSPTDGSFTYTLTVTDAFGCKGTVQAIINVNPTVEISPGVAQVCAGSDLQLTGNPDKGKSPYISVWTDTGANFLNDSLISNPIFNVPTSGVYPITYTVTDDNGCVATASTTITVHENPTVAPVSSPDPSEVCEGETILLFGMPSGGSGSYQTHSWTGNISGLNFANSQNPSFVSLSSGLYNLTYTVTDNNSCTASGNISLTINEPPVASITPDPATVCAGQPLVIAGSGTGGTAGYTHQWGGDLQYLAMPHNAASVTFTSNVSATLSYTVTDSKGCKDTEIINVTVSPKPTTPVATNNGPLCTGDMLELFTDNVLNASYTWVGPNGFSSSFEDPTKLGVVLADSGDYKIVLTVNGCNSDTGTTTVVINPKPAVPLATNVGPYCEDETINLSTAAITGTYSWTGPIGFTSSNQNPFILNATPAMSGNYSLIVTVSGCNSDAATTSVLVNAKPATPSASNGGPYCEGDQIDLSTATVSGATYDWVGPNGFSNSNEDPSIGNASVDMSGDYKLVVWVNGCKSDSSNATTVLVNPIPSAPTPTNSGPYCAGDQINLFSNTVASATYAWTGPIGFSDSNEDPLVSDSAIVSMSGVYSLTVTVNGCTSLAQSTTVDVYPVPLVPIGLDEAVCEGATVPSLSASGTNVVWYSDPGLTVVAGSGNMLNTGQTAVNNYTYYAVDTLNGCSSPTAIISLNILPAASMPSIAPSFGPFCKGVDYGTLSPIVAPAGQYIWYSDASLNDSIGTGSIVPFDSLGTLTYYVIEQVGDCRSSAAAVSVTINPQPSADFTFTPNSGTAPVLVSYSNTSALNGSVSLTSVWVLFGTDSLKVDSFAYNFDKEGIYEVLLLIENESGCTDTITKQLIIDVTPVFELPNVFSPNGDGKNDEFKLNVAGYKDMTVSIFNRWGAFIYEFGLDGSWDGRTASGLESPNGTYFYIVKAVKNDGTTKEERGYLTLVR